MDKEIIKSEQAPEPIGPYSQAVKAGNFLFLSGQVGMDPATGKIKSGSITEETAQVMKNLETVLAAAAASFDHVVKTTIFLKEMSFFSEMNTEYGKHFKSHYPARETVAVKELPRDVNVEISMIAYLQ